MRDRHKREMENVETQNMMMHTESFAFDDEESKDRNLETVNSSDYGEKAYNTLKRLSMSLAKGQTL